VREWWENLQLREKRTLIAGGAALAAILYYFVVWQPLSEGIADKRERLAGLEEERVWMRDAVKRYQELDESAKPAQVGEAVYSLADRTARSAGLGDSLDGVDPVEDSQVRVQFESVAFNKLLQWLATLNREHGIVAGAVSLEKAGDGRVNGQLTLKQGSS